jgi:hypothetical protein
VSRPDRERPEEGPGEGVHEVRSPQRDLAGQLRAHLRLCRLQEPAGRPGIYVLSFFYNFYSLFQESIV